MKITWQIVEGGVGVVKVRGGEGRAEAGGGWGGGGRSCL